MSKRKRPGRKKPAKPRRRPKRTDVFVMDDADDPVPDFRKEITGR